VRLCAVCNIARIEGQIKLVAPALLWGYAQFVSTIAKIEGQIELVASALL